VETAYAVVHESVIATAVLSESAQVDLDSQLTSVDSVFADY
jgi:hypothetical protein